MNDFQAAYQNSVLTQEPTEDETLIHQLRQKGLYCVAAESTRYCGVSDALLPGCDRYLIAAFKEQNRASVLMHILDVEHGNDPETSYRVLDPIEPIDIHSEYEYEIPEEEYDSDSNTETPRFRLPLSQVSATHDEKGEDDDIPF